MNDLDNWISDPLLETLARRAGEYLAGQSLTLEDLSLGQPISWALVRDEQGRRALGTALTPSAEFAAPGALYQGLPPDWSAWPLAELPGRIMADHPLERCLALAIINAISQYRLGREGLAGVETPHRRPSVVEWVARQEARRVVVIGNMGPLVAGLAEAGVPHVVFERHPGNRSGALPDAQEWAWLGRADGLVITGATLTNHTLSPILTLARQARFKLLVGFSAQAHPAFLAGCGATHVFSLHIRDIDRVRRLLQVGHWNHMFETEPGYLASLATDGDQTMTTPDAPETDHSHQHAHTHAHQHDHEHRHGDLTHSHPHGHAHSHAHDHQHRHAHEHDPAAGDQEHAHEGHTGHQDHEHDELSRPDHARTPHDHEHG